MHNITLELDKLTAALEAKGYFEPNASLAFKDSSQYTQFRLEFDYRKTPKGLVEFETVRDYEVENPEDISNLVALALKRIDELPTVQEARVKEFVNLVERVKDEADDLGLDVDFINPLAALMEKLATNALPAPKS